MDIDIDFSTKFSPSAVFPQAVPASMVRDGELRKHQCGYYLQNIPVDEVTKLAAIPYNEAEEVGYMKIDFLHLSILDIFSRKDQIRQLIDIPPNWELLLDPVVVEQLFQISKHYELVSKLRPKSVQELADCIALIRPGKRHLINAYVVDKEATRSELYRRIDDGVYFKKSHAVSYALTIVLQLHLIEHGLLKKR